jgi:hypothetical protein
VIELGIQPVIRGVAGFASGGEHRSHVVGKCGFLEIRLVAGITLRRHRSELAVGRAFVAGIAVHRRVRSGEREAIVVFLHLLDRDLPSPDRVALFAVGA